RDLKLPDRDANPINVERMDLPFGASLHLRTLDLVRIRNTRLDLRITIRVAHHRQRNQVMQRRPIDLKEVRVEVQALRGHADNTARGISVARSNTSFAFCASIRSNVAY